MVGDVGGVERCGIKYDEQQGGDGSAQAVNGHAGLRTWDRTFNETFDEGSDGRFDGRFDGT